MHAYHLLGHVINKYLIKKLKINKISFFDKNVPVKYYKKEEKKEEET